MNNINIEMKHRGYSLEDMGGNCTAYTRYLDNGNEVMVTDSDWIGLAPESIDDQIFVTMVYTDNGDVLDEVTLSTSVGSFLRDVQCLKVA